MSGWGDECEDQPSNENSEKKDEFEKKEDRPAPYRPDELNLEEEVKLQVDTVGENFKRYKEQKVTCFPLDIIKPIDKFEDVIESKLLLENVKSLRYTEMTPIQKWAMPAIMGGYDLIGCAQTGSGKTAAFLLPVLQTIMKSDLSQCDSDENCQNPHCIIISPTRELAKQIYVQSKMLSKDSLVKSCYIYGQISTAHLKAQLSKGCHILVATLGRLKDFVQRGWIAFRNIKYIILDEGDRLVDEGFTGDLKAIFTHETMPPKTERQTLFFSATFKKNVQLTAKEYLKDDFIFITVGRVGAANEDIKQEFLQVSRADKKRELRNILKTVPESDKTIIFTQTKAAADMLAGFFNSLKLSATSIHGDRHQSQREEAIAVFKRGDKRFLISSPVGNRGLDLPKVSLVINYDLPDNIDEYVHRIGRTGRAGHTGRAISFFDQDRDREILPDLLKILEEAKQEIPSWLEELRSSCNGELSAPTKGGNDEDWGASTRDSQSAPKGGNAGLADDDWGSSTRKSQSEPSGGSAKSGYDDDWGSSTSNNRQAPKNGNAGFGDDDWGSSTRKSRPAPSGGSAKSGYDDDWGASTSKNRSTPKNGNAGFGDEDDWGSSTRKSQPAPSGGRARSSNNDDWGTSTSKNRSGSNVGNAGFGDDDDWGSSTRKSQPAPSGGSAKGGYDDDWGASTSNNRQTPKNGNAGFGDEDDWGLTSKRPATDNAGGHEKKLATRPAPAASNDMEW
jgi:probable ATP-dependent RNA helicase DDX4